MRGRRGHDARVALCSAIILAALTLAPWLAVGHAQDQSAPVVEAVDDATGERLGGDAATAPPPPIRAPSPVAPSPAAAPASGACTGGYSQYADSSGRYSTLGCLTPGPAAASAGSRAAAAPPCELYPSGNQPATTAPATESATANTGGVPLCHRAAGGPALTSAQVPACQLFASGSQPASSSIAATGSGAPLTAATSAAPPCPLGGGGTAAINGGAPPCQLYASGSQPGSTSFGAGNYPITPVPAPVRAIPTRGTLAGANC